MVVDKTLRVSDTVEVIGRSGPRGRVKEFLPDGRALVFFKVPNQPAECEKCGSVGSLSVNGGTGEVECLRTSCGHGHGFHEREEVIKPGHLTNISAQRRHAAKMDFSGRLDSFLKDGIEGEVLSEYQREQILKIINA